MIHFHQTGRVAYKLFISTDAYSTWSAFRSVILVWKEARCWNSDSASSNIGFLMMVPSARFRSTWALMKTLSTAGFEGTLSGIVFSFSVSSLALLRLARWIRFDSSSSITLVSSRTAFIVGVVAVIWIPCNRKSNLYVTIGSIVLYWS